MIKPESVREILCKYEEIRDVEEAIRDIEKIDRVLSGNAPNHEREKLITDTKNKYKKKFNDMFLKNMPELIAQINNYIRLDIKKVVIASMLLWLNNWLNTVRNMIIIYACLVIERENEKDIIEKEFRNVTKNKSDFESTNVNIAQQMIEELALNCLNNIK